MGVREPLNYLKNIDKIVCSYVYGHLSGEKFYPLTRLSDLPVIQKGIRTTALESMKLSDRIHPNPEERGQGRAQEA